jgi:hypothetical protein
MIGKITFRGKAAKQYERHFKQQDVLLSVRRQHSVETASSSAVEDAAVAMEA